MPDVLNPSSPLDLGIARAVNVLHEHGSPLGITTFESCDASPGHCYDQPTIRFHGGQDAGWHALAICLAYALPVCELKRVWQIETNEPSGPFWELIFRPAVTGGVITPPPATFYAAAS